MIAFLMPFAFLWLFLGSKCDYKKAKHDNKKKKHFCVCVLPKLVIEDFYFLLYSYFPVDYSLNHY